MRQSRIDADAEAGVAEQCGQFAQPQRRRDAGGGDARRNTFRALPLGRVTGGENRRQTALAQRLPDFAPVGFIPQLVSAAGCGQQDGIANDAAAIRRLAQPGEIHCRRTNAVIERQGAGGRGQESDLRDFGGFRGFRVWRGRHADGAQCQSGKPAIALDSVQMGGDDERAVIETGGQRFACDLSRVTQCFASRLAGDQRAFDQTLRIKDGVVGLCPELRSGGADFPSERRPVCQLAERPAPAADSDGNDFLNGRMQARDVGKRLFDAPVDSCVGKTAGQIAGDRQVVHDIAE